MKKICIILSLICSAYVCYAQVTDDFSDGDLTNNPTWTADNTNNWTVVNGQLRSNSATTSSSFYVSTPSAQATAAQWDFFVQLQFNTSGANFVDVYLMSEQADLLSSANNGYFVRIGGTPDEISLYKITAGVASLLINGTDGVTNRSNNLLRIKVKREATNSWSLERDALGGTDYILEGTATDNTFSTSNFFGIRIQQSTATFFNKHFFDEIYAGDIVVEKDPPVLNDLKVLSNTQLSLLFNEPLNITSAQTTSHYKISNNTGNPTLAELQNDEKTVLLTFSPPFTNGITQSLDIAGVLDLAGNNIVPISKLFLFFQPMPVNSKDIILTEIFADPSPQVKLPEAEFIEIYNRSTNPVDLSGWNFSDGSSIATLPAQIILPGQHWILCATASVASFIPFGNTLGLSNFPTLNNAGESLTLKTNTGLLIDSLSYSLASYRDENKKEGGWTLELINPNKLCIGEDNWTASTDLSGGTPGKVNAVNDITPDLVGPKLLAITEISSNELLLTFDERLAKDIAVSSFTISPSIAVFSASFTSSALNQIKLSLSTKLQASQNYTIEINDLRDCSGNIIQAAHSKADFELPLPAAFRDILITEIFPDPSPQIGLSEAEFIEIYNRSSNPIELKGWKFSDGSSVATFPSQIIAPKQYWIICATANMTLFSSSANLLGISNFPTLNNSGESLTLTNSTGLLIDSLNYSLEWYRDKDKQEGGWTLELIDTNNPCGEEDNWMASEDPKGGTPGKANSVNANKPDLAGPKLLSVSVVKPNEMLLRFDEKLEKPLNTVVFKITPQLELAISSFTSLSLREIKLVLLKDLSARQLYQLEISNLRDCNGNFIQAEFNKISFALPEAAEPGDLLINEILFNPRSGGVDFVEIINTSSRYINLKNWSLANREEEVFTNLKLITDTDYILSPQDYLVFASDGSAIKNQYPNSIEKYLFNASLPSMSDDEGSIAILSDERVAIDYFMYEDGYHSPLLKDKEGVSLERISLAEPTNNPQNWKSANAAAGYATPGYLNSNSRLENSIDENAVHIEPEIFSPAIPGQDFAQINYRFDQSALAANIKIVDHQGRLIKEIANNETLAFEGFYRWDGDRDDGSKARMGYYFVWFEVFDLSGMVKTYRKRVVIGR
jgi:Lamin Tail Domain/Bacterial Ig-like domain